MCVYGSAVISSSSSSPSSVEEGSSRTCVGAVPRDLSLYDIMSGIGKKKKEKEEEEEGEGKEKEKELLWRSSHLIPDRIA